MASDTIALGIADPDARPIGERLHDWVVTVDHKKLGILYILYSLLMLVIGGVEATIMRIQLIVPHNHFVSPQVFNRMFTMHGTTMIFFVAMPILFGFGTYLIPLMIGTRDMAFPRLNAFSFWMTAFGGLLLTSALSVGTDFTAPATRPTWDGLPMRRSRRAHSHRGTARTSGRWPCSSPASAALEPRSISSPPFCACAARG